MYKISTNGEETTTTNDALPSDDATFQIVELNEFPKAAGVVILGGSCVAKGLFFRQ